MQILVTRPEPDATRLAGRLREMGHEPLVEPLLEITFSHGDSIDLENVQALVATSRNGLRALARNPSLETARKLPLFAVGRATAALALELDFETIHTGGGNAEALLPVLLENANSASGALVHLAGETSAWDLKGALEFHGFQVNAPVVYRVIAAAEISSAARTAIASGTIDAVILMSPKTAYIFSCLIEKHGLGDAAAMLSFYCISKAAAAELPEYPMKNIHIPDHPRQDELLALINH